MSRDILQSWEKSRSGAWASRGFHFQHLFSALILVRQWAGLAPMGFLVPEGLDDCVLELTDHLILVQIKSRKEGTFREVEIQKFLAEMDFKASSIFPKSKVRTALALEQPSSSKAVDDIDQLFDGKTRKVVWCNAPEDEIVSLLTTHLDTAEVIADGIASDLYRLVAEASAANASLPFKNRRRISTTEVEKRIFERLEAGDPAAIDSALASGFLEPVDFNTQVDEPSFYQGVKVKPGHVVARLVINRPDEMKKILATIRRRRHVLISGPSGAGKSALMWLSAYALAGELRWYQVASKATAANADSIIRFVRARRPTESSPIGLAFDEIGSSNSDLWDVLVRELRGFPTIYVLGSIRQENVNLITNQSDTDFIAVRLDEKLAQLVWKKLSDEKQTSWVHWREPFEQAEGLMLEYVHLLTKGKRLAAVIEEQVRQREHEDRHDELAIIRSTAVLCARGGEVEVSKLIKLLGVKPGAASIALRRLIDEHLVRESRPGILGGLHMLRSKALSKASHDEAAFLTEDSLWQCLPAATSETLPRVIQSILAETQGGTEVAAFQKLTETLEGSRDIEVWVSILTGLGLATLERHVTSLMKILEEHGVQRALWWLASIFTDPENDIPNLTEFEQWPRLRNAVLTFRALPKHDLRLVCLKLLSEKITVPPFRNLQQANHLLSCLTPICGSEPVRMSFAHEFPDNGEQDIRQVAALLSTAYLIGPDVAENLVDAFGGEQVLFTWFRSQTPWATAPVIESDGTHGRTVRSDFFLVADQYQPDPHKTVCNICETLIAISPGSDAAASDAVNPSGQPVSVGNHILWSKNMPRRNIPAKTRVAWNVAFRQILLARSATDSLTDYTRLMAQLVQRTEKVFRSFTEKWIKEKGVQNADALVAEINEIVGAVNTLAYTTPEKPSSAMTVPVQGGGANDTIGAPLVGTLGNLVRRLSRIPGEEGAKALATFAGSLAAMTQANKQSDIWRTMSLPPLNKLAALSKRLSDVACILHEMAYDDSQTAIHGIVNAARRGTLGKAIHAAARHCRSLADQRFRDRLRALEDALKEHGWNSRCRSRPIDESDSVYWPAREVAVLMEIADFETEVRCFEDGLAIGQKHLGNDWRFRIVPVINGQVLASLALLPSSDMPLPDLEFSQEWKDHIDQPFLASEIAERFNEAVMACTQISAILACRGLENLHPEEDEMFSKAMESFNNNHKSFAEVAENTASEFLAEALDYLERTWNQVLSEIEAKKVGQAVAEPLYMILYPALAGQQSKQATELALVRIRILQAECNGVCLANSDQKSEF